MTTKNETTRGYEIKKIGNYWYHRKKGAIGWECPEKTKQQTLNNTQNEKQYSNRKIRRT